MRILLCLAALCGLLFAAHAEPELSFPVQTKIGKIVLPAGQYKVHRQGNLLFLTDSQSAKSYVALFRTEKLSKPASCTVVMGQETDGVKQVAAILLQGEDLKLVF